MVIRMIIYVGQFECSERILKAEYYFCHDAGIASFVVISTGFRETG